MRPCCVSIQRIGYTIIEESHFFGIMEPNHTVSTTNTKASTRHFLLIPRKNLLFRRRVDVILMGCTRVCAICCHLSTGKGSTISTPRIPYTVYGGDSGSRFSHHIYIRQTRVFKDFLINTLHSFWDNQRMKGSTYIKGIFLYGFTCTGDTNGLQHSTLVEHSFANARDTFRKGDVLQRETITESLVSKGACTIQFCHSDFLEGCTLKESLFTNFRQCAREDQLLNFAVRILLQETCKCMICDFRHTFVENNILKIRAITCIIGNTFYNTRIKNNFF